MSDNASRGDGAIAAAPLISAELQQTKPEAGSPTRPLGDLPIIPAALRSRWREMLDTLAEVVGAPAGRFWRLSESGAEVIIAHGSPLPGEGMRVANKGSNLLYQQVVADRAVLDVTSIHWPTSAEAAQGLKDYLGLPIAWPDGTVFGVIEVLTNDPQLFSLLYRRLVLQVRDQIEDQLAALVVSSLQARTDTDLRLERESAQLAIDVLSLGAWSYEIATDQLHADAGWYRIFGLDAAAPLQSLDDFKRLIHPKDAPRITEVDLLGLKEAGDAENAVVFRTVRPDGETRWIRSSARVVESTPARTVGVVTDVTESHVTEAALHQGRAALLEAEAVLTDIRERLQLAAEASGLGIWEVDFDAGTFACDANLNTIFGVEAGALPDLRSLHGRVHSQDRSLADFSAMAKQADQAPKQALEFRIVRPSGEIRWVSCTAQLNPASAISRKRLRGLVMDMTEAHRIQEELDRNTAALQHIEQLMQLANWRFDIATQQFFASAMLNQMNDSDPAAPPLTQADLEQLLSPRSVDGGIDAVRHCARTGQSYSVDVHYLRPDGTSFVANVRGQAERDATGTITGVVGTVQDMSEREAAAARLSALAQALPAGAFYRFEAGDDPFAIVQASAGIEALIGRSDMSLPMDQAAFLGTIMEPDQAVYLAEIERSRQTGTIFDCQFRVERDDGSLAWLQARAVPQPRDGGGTLWDGMLRDVSAERQVAEALQQAQDEMAAMDRDRGEFLATMSHEVRTPMHTVIGMARLALQTELSAKQRHYLGKINASANGLVSTVDDVLDFARIEAGSLHLRNSDFTLESVLQSLSLATALDAGEKGLDIVYDVAASVPRRLHGDPARLAQVLIALVANALKLTESGEVVVSVERALAGGVPALEFRVRDTGPWLNPEQIASLFNPFTKATSRQGRRYDSAGLRLAVCRQLVERMGGAIGVQSKPGRGTTFQFTLALEEAAAPADDSATPMDVLADLRVLVVDDNASVRAVLTKVLDGLGILSQLVASGPEALAALRVAAQASQPFDIVLIDWRMPGMDGLELARRIRADPSIQSIAAVLMANSYGRDQISGRAHELGLHGLLNKPVTEAAMFDIMRGVFAPAPDDAIFAPPDNDQGIARLAGRLILVVDDNAFDRQATADLLELADVNVDMAASGAEALERLAERSYDAVLVDMHMAQMDGRETMRRIRRNPAWASMPVIALTARTRIWDRSASRKAGMAAHLAKPIDEAALHRTLADIFAWTPAVDSSAAPDFEAVLRQLDGDLQRFERLLRGFLRDFSDLPAKLGTMIGTDDLPQTAALAQLVKGSADHLEAHQLAAAAELLAQAAASGDGQKVGAPAEAFRLQLRAVLDAIVQRLDQDSLAAAQVPDAVPEPPAAPAGYAPITQAEFTALYNGPTDQGRPSPMRFADDLVDTPPAPVRSARRSVKP